MNKKETLISATDETGERFYVDYTDDGNGVISVVFTDFEGATRFCEGDAAFSALNYLTYNYSTCSFKVVSYETATLTLSKEIAEKLDKWLSEPENEDDYNNNYLSEDDTFCTTAFFENGYQMDVKCCGVQYEEGTSNACWTEAVLFNSNGSEMGCSEPSDEYLGEWTIEDFNGNIYKTIVVKDDAALGA